MFFTAEEVGIISTYEKKISNSRKSEQGKPGKINILSSNSTQMKLSDDVTNKDKSYFMF